MDEQKYIKLENGAYCRLYKDENGRPRGYIELKSHNAKLYAGYILIRKDLELIIEAISQLKSNNNNKITSQSLSFFSIVTYAKCFTSNSGRGPSLNFKAVFKIAENELTIEHERILSLRNDYVAHAGNSFEKCAITGTINMEIGGMHLEGNLLYVTNIGTLDIFLKLCEYVKLYVQDKIKDFESKIFKDFQELSYEGIMDQIKFPNLNQLFVLEKELSDIELESFVFKPYNGTSF